MKAKFWLERWQQNQIGFHQETHNPLLAEFWPHLNIGPDATVFVPLCGKSLDMRWLGEQGHDVVGVELARIAVENFFADEPCEISEMERFTRYDGQRTAGKLSVLVGDFFDLTVEELGADVAAVFDRGALIALPPDMRARYADHLLRIIPDGAQILLLTLEYDQRLLAGPPHAVMPEEVERLFAHRCQVQTLDAFVTRDLPPRFADAGLRDVVESVHVITKQE